MSRVSDLQIHKENYEMELKNKLQKSQDQVASLSLSLEEKEEQINALKEQLNEFNEDFQNRLEAEINQLKFVDEKKDQELIDSYLIQIENLKNELKTKEAYEISQNLIDSKNEQIDELTNQVELLENKLKQLEQGSDKLKESLQDQIENLEIEKQAFLNQNESLVKIFVIKIKFTILLNQELFLEK